MIYDLLTILLILVIILASIMIIKNAKEMLEDFNFKPRKSKFIKKIERDTKDLEVDKLIKEIDKYDKKRIFRKIK